MCLQLLNALGAVAASSSSGAGMTFASLERIPSFVWWLATWTGLYYALRVFLSRTHANRLVSTVHACIVGSGGVVLLLRTAALEPVAQFLELRADTEYYGTAFLTYLCCDLLYELAEAEQLDYVSLFHHALFLTTGALCAAHGFLGFPFAWLAVGELSTPFINLHAVLTQKLRAGHAAPWMSTLQKVNVSVGAVLFFLCRIVLYGFGLCHLFSSKSTAVLLPPPHPILYLPLGCVVLGYGLNCVWMVAVAKTTRKVLSGKFTKRATS